MNKSSKEKLKVGLTYDLISEHKSEDDEPPDSYAEYDREETINYISLALKSNNCDVELIGNFFKLFQRISSTDLNSFPDIIFNIAEGKKGRNRESQVPILLEAFSIPYVGSDGLTMGITLDKYIFKKLMFAYSILVPKGFSIPNLSVYKEKYEDIKNLKLPLFVKPRYEGSSKGITENSIIEDFNKLEDQVDKIINLYHQPAIIEEFIYGYEFTVAIIGNSNPMVFRPVQVSINGNKKLGNLYYMNRMVYNNEVSYLYPPSCSKKTEEEMVKIALEVYRIVDCKDFGRVDFRVDEDGNVYVLEINPLPAISKSDVFGLLAEKLGFGYEKMIMMIFNSAVERLNLL